MQENAGESGRPPTSMSRRFMLLKVGVALNALAGVLLAVPLVGYLASAARKKSMIDALAWIPLGRSTSSLKARPGSRRSAIPHHAVGRSDR